MPSRIADAVAWPAALGALALAAALGARPESAAALTAPPSRTASAHSPTLTPTPPPVPQRTGDLGTKEVTGRVYDARQGVAAGIADATLEYARVATFPLGQSGSVVTDARGNFAFRLVLHDTDSVRIAVSAPGFAPEERSYSGYGLWSAPPLTIGLLPLSGTIEIAPSNGLLLPCEGDGEVTLTNGDPPGGDALTITAVLVSNSYSQGDYGTGFSWDLSHIALPLMLAPGERIAFPVHYSAAGQSFPSRLTVQVRSTARNGPGFAVPYRGGIAGCESPTSTPTVTPAPPPSCPGDCDGDGTVAIAELMCAVTQALGLDGTPCLNADRDGDGRIAVDELVAGVAAALGGC